MTGAGGIGIEVREHVGICRIDSPATQNALSPDLLGALAAGLERLDGTEDVHAIALIGSDEVFATGADARILAASEVDPAAQAEFWERFEAIGAPIIAGASGWALGTGCELAFAADLLVASKTTRFGQPEVALGLIPSGGAIQRLTRTLGRHRTMELVLTGRRMGAEQAGKFGLVNVVADRKRWLEATLSLATQVSERAPVALRLAKRAISTAERESYADGVEAADAMLAEAMATEDRVEGVSAFLEGRPPKFQGR